MEEHIHSIRSYLPVEFAEQETNEFIEYLVSAYLENLTTQKYQFSFTAFHMLYMSYIYKIKWFLKQQGNVNIENSLQEFIRQNRGATFNTIFDLSQMPEKSSLEKLLQSLSFHANDVDLCKNLVEVRNKCSHASGKIYFKRQRQIENYILEELDNIRAIQNKIKHQVKIVFENLITEIWEKNWIEADLKEWIIKNYLSKKDIEVILQLKPAFLNQNSDTKEIVFKKTLYCVLVSELVKYLDNKGDYFIKSLNALMKQLSQQIDIRKDLGDSERLKNTQEIIEEKIVPILTNLSNEEAVLAQEILKLNVVE
jgi:hypothetical protein